MKNKITISLLLLVLIWHIQSCKRDAPIVTNNTSTPTPTPVNVTPNQLMGTWTYCHGCGLGGQSISLQVKFIDSLQVQIIDDYDSGTNIFGTDPFAYGTYKISGGDTISMTLAFDSTQYPAYANDTNLVQYKIMAYSITKPYNIPSFEITLINSSLNLDLLGSSFCPAYNTNPPRADYWKYNTCYGN
jgi:hypothetical protein